MHYRRIGSLVLSTLLWCTPVSAARACSFSAAGFPGDGFVAAITYRHLSEREILLAVEADGIEGAYEATLALHYDVPASYSPPDEALADARPALAVPLAITASGAGQFRAEITVTSAFPHLAFVLAVRQGEGDVRAHCAELYMARVLAGSVPPNATHGELTRLRPIAAH